MSIKQVLQDRLNELLSAVEQSAANHNALVGRLHECKHQIEQIGEKALEDSANAVVNDLLDQIVPENKTTDVQQ